jgi:hypothetical protein
VASDDGFWSIFGEIHELAIEPQGRQIERSTLREMPS